MPVDIRVDGADQFQRVARQLREVGNTELRRELYRGINRAVKPLKEAAQDAARRRLPRAGGLGEKVASSKFTTRKRAGTDPGIKLIVAGPLDLDALDRGQVRHPVFGHRDRWVAQSVPANVISDAVDGEADKVRSELLAVLDVIEGRLAHDG